MLLSALGLDGVSTKSVIRHCKNHKKLHREHIIGCQGVKMFLLKDPFKWKERVQPLPRIWASPSGGGGGLDENSRDNCYNCVCSHKERL